MSTVLAAKNTTTNPEIFDEPEAFLNIEFKDDTNFDNVFLSLPKSSDYGITNLVGVTTIEGKQFPVTLSGNNNIFSVKKEYKAALIKFLNQLKTLKKVGTSSLTDSSTNQKLDSQTVQTISQTTKNITGNSITKSRLGSWIDNGRVASIGIVGDAELLISIQNKLSAIAKNSVLTKTIELEQAQKAIEAKIESKVKVGLNKETATQEVVKETIEAESTKAGSSITIPKVELSQQTIAQVDAILKTEPSGNKFLDDKDLNNLNLKVEEKDTVKTLLNQYNQTSEIQKNNIQPILESTNLAEDKDLVEKVGSVFESVKVKAGCEEVGWGNSYWWGVRTVMNKCRANRISYDWGRLVNYSTYVVGLACGAINIFHPISSYLCVGGAGAILLSATNYSRDMDWYGDRCNMVRMDWNWWATYNGGCA